MALGHKTCTLAADNLILVREGIRAIARKHGLLATFMPKYVLSSFIFNCSNVRQLERVMKIS